VYAGNVIYELYLSPLSRFPGPKLWAISRIPGQLSVLRGRNHLDILALHERYGPVVRISPNELAFNTAQAFRDIYGVRPGGCFAKDRSHYLPPANGVDHLVCAVDNAVHARQRRLLAHAFSERALRDQEGLIKGYVNTMIVKLRSKITKDSPRIDINSWMNYTTFDITGDLMFGESFDCLKDSQLHPWIQLIFSSIKALAIAGVANQFPIVGAIFHALIPKEVKKKAIEHFNLAAQKVDRRLETNMTRPDLISAILQNGFSEEEGQYLDGGRIMSRAEIHSNAFILIVAGSETAATLLSGAIFYLCTNLLVMSRLVSEIRSAFTKEEEITFRNAACLTYLAAVIEESLRLHPPFVTSLSRIFPPGGSMVDGYYVPGGVCFSAI
jgi:cytochrome P450